MCGITGVLGAATEQKEKIIQAMTQEIFHRGPDQDGFFVDNRVGLGMRRLSIIDLSSGKQPIESTDGSMCIFFNGEIYNYKELRAELVALGRTFTTESDTEVILQMYEQYGSASVSKLRGMFCFAIYNKVSGMIFIARDFFGIKPLYFWREGETIRAFASEIKALLKHPGFVREINHDAVFNYLRFQYNPLTETFFKNIFSLPPGHILEIDTKEGTHTLERYWDFTFVPDTGKDFEQTKKEIVGTLRDSVAHHMISDVPVGSFLSGGVDSSIIAVLMQEISGTKKNKTFTVGFDVLTEGVEAKTTSDFLGTDHVEVTIGQKEYFDVLPKLVWHFDQPVADPSAVGLYFVSREARKKVKVVLSGEGADELFGGYNIYLESYARRRVAWIPQNVLRIGLWIPFEYWGKNFLRRASAQLSDWYIGNASIFSKKEISQLWKKNSLGDLPHVHTLDALYQKVSKEDVSDSVKMQYIDIHTWLVGDILAKADTMTMANSLELRVPFLDTKVAHLAQALPDTFKWKGGVTKYILREAFAGIIPEETRHRKKLGFPTPIREWLRAPDCLIYADIRQSEYLQEHCDMQYVEGLIEGHTSGRKDNARRLYLLYMLALWYTVYIKDNLKNV